MIHFFEPSDSESQSMLVARAFSGNLHIGILFLTLYLYLSQMSLL